MVKLFVFLILAAFAFQVGAEEKKKGVKFKTGDRIDFESLLIEGENKKPELSVVTGNLGERDLGFLKHKEDFVEFMADDAGEEIQ